MVLRRLSRPRDEAVCFRIGHVAPRFSSRRFMRDKQVWFYSMQGIAKQLWSLPRITYWLCSCAEVEIC
jgi:hypothetical protein